MNVHIFSYKAGQTLHSLTSDKIYMWTKKKGREYVPMSIPNIYGV